MHERNRHTGRYDFEKLLVVHPPLKKYVRLNPSGEQTIEFADPIAVKALNQALLKLFYDISEWNIPEGYLCPPVPGRADYIHSAADLLAAFNGDVIPQGAGVRVLDVGVGANGIYPLIGVSEYGWSFVGSDIDPVALKAVQAVVDANSKLKGKIALRLQKNSANILKGVVGAGERFDLVVSNPPFHSSLEDARAGTERKWRNLGRESGGKKPHLNFGGQAGELWCEGGELSFIRMMIRESKALAKDILVFSSLVSKDETLEALYRDLEAFEVDDVAVMELIQGQKKSRVVAWTYFSPEERDAWSETRFKGASRAE